MVNHLLVACLSILLAVRSSDDAMLVPDASRSGDPVIEATLSDPIWRSFVNTVVNELATPVSEARLIASCRATLARAPGADLTQSVDVCIQGALDWADPYAEYIPPRIAAAQARTGPAPHASLGLEWRTAQDAREPLIVLSTIRGGPAELAGLLPGDRLLAIDGVTIMGLNQAERLALLRGAADSEVAVRFARDGTEKTLRVRRRVMRIATARSSVLEGRVLYLRINRFDRVGTATDVASVVASQLAVLGELEQPSVVLDLRANGGGEVGAVAQVASLFLARGTPLFASVVRHGTEVLAANSDAIAASGEVRQAEDFLQRARLVVLVDALTASGAEALAKSLRIARSAIIVGEPARGGLTVRQRFGLDDRAAVVLTVGRLAVPDAGAADISGIPIDVRVASGRGFEFGDIGRDVGLQAALRVVRDRR